MTLVVTSPRWPSRDPRADRRTSSSTGASSGIAPSPTPSSTPTAWRRSRNAARRCICSSRCLLTPSTSTCTRRKRKSGFAISRSSTNSCAGRLVMPSVAGPRPSCSSSAAGSGPAACQRCRCHTRTQRSSRAAGRRPRIDERSEPRPTSEGARTDRRSWHRTDERSDIAPTADSPIAPTFKPLMPLGPVQGYVHHRR